MKITAILIGLSFLIVAAGCTSTPSGSSGMGGAASIGGSGPLWAVKGDKGELYSASLSADGKTIVTGIGGGQVALWDASSGAHVADVDDGTSEPWEATAAFAPGGTDFASAYGNKLAIFDTAGRTLLATMPAHPPAPPMIYCPSMAYSPDGHLIAVGRTHTVEVWDVAAKKLTMTIPEGSGWVNSVAFSPIGSILAIGGDGSVQLWDTKAHKVIRKLTGSDTTGQSVAFAPDGRTVAGGDAESTVRFWDVASGKLLNQFRAVPNSGDDDKVSALAYFPNGQTLAISCGITIELWDTTTMTHIGRLSGLGLGGDQKVDISRDGTRAITTEGGWLRCWDVTPAGLAKLSPE